MDAFVRCVVGRRESVHVRVFVPFCPSVCVRMCVCVCVCGRVRMCVVGSVGRVSFGLQEASSRVARVRVPAWTTIALPVSERWFNQAAATVTE